MMGPGGRYHLVNEDLSRQPPCGGILLELGCGGGEALLILEQKHGFDRIIGLDIAAGEGPSDSQIEYAAANLNETWPVQSGSIDILVAMMVIEHLFDPFHSFHEIRRVLRPEGFAYVNVPLITSLRHRFELLVGRLPSTSSPYPTWFEKEEWDGGHLHWFSLASLHDLARHCGLRIDVVRGVGRMHRLKTWLPGFLASEVTLRLRSAGTSVS